VWALKGTSRRQGIGTARFLFGVDTEGAGCGSDDDGSMIQYHSFARTDAGQKANKRSLIRRGAALGIAIVSTALSACNDHSSIPVARAKFVRTEIVGPQDRQPSLTLTGEVQARFRADLSFRTSGRVVARHVDVGAHVDAGKLLAQLDPAEQQADFDAATAAVNSAESQMSLARTEFERKKYLISSGFTTRGAFDQAQEQLRNAEGALEVAKSQLGTAKESLGDTELRAGATGIITERSVEVGQVVRAAQSVFALAQDGDRDGVFYVNESFLDGDFKSNEVSLALVSNPNVTALGEVREISPALDQKSSTVRVKVTIRNPPAAMTLGTAIAGTVKRTTVRQIVLPWTALMAMGSKPAVWVVDPGSKTASLRAVSISRYEAGSVLISGGLEAGERVVVDGGKLLSSGQAVTYDRNPS
jgi:membrane fusion protein, multidrug efflux system